MRVRFFGVRGSTPCHGEEVARYGGNTSCVALDVPGHDPVLFDLGTGLRYFGLTLPVDRPFVGRCLLTHPHWDHVQGIPFFAPLLRAGARLDVFGPQPDHGAVSLTDAMAESIRPPMFPVSLDQLPGEVAFHELGRETVRWDATDGVESAPIEVMARPVPHVGATNGYRLQWRGRTVTYVSDHQQPHDGSFSVTDEAMELCRGADVLIHDAQYTTAEFDRKRTWGHCTVEYAVWIAAEAGVRTLVLFHHDPAHDDDLVDVLASSAAACGRRHGVEVIAAREGLELTLEPAAGH